MLKQISAKRGKTDADFEEMARIEWYASLYTFKERLIIPSHVLEASFIGGARKLKLGKQAQAGLFVENHAQLAFDGDNLTIDQLFERDENRFTVPVRVQSSRIMRTRCIVEAWETDIVVVYEDTTLNRQVVLDAINACGEQVGLCDWRPKYGRFEIGEVADI